MHILRLGLGLIFVSICILSFKITILRSLHYFSCLLLGLKELINHKNLFNFWCYVLIVSLFYSKFLLSVSIFALVFLSMFRLTSSEGYSLVFNKLFFPSFKSLFKNYAYLAVATLFFVCVISGINSQNTWEWIHQMILKIPFLAFPIIFLNRPAVSKLEYRNLYLCLIIISLISAVQVSINYALNYEAITYAIGSGHTIPTPTHHTRYSVMIAIAILATIVLNISDFKLTDRALKTTRITGVLLFVFLHVLSIRSGLVALYGGTFVLGVTYLINKKNFYLLGLFILGLLAIPFIAYNTITSFYNKVHYTMYDLKMNKEGKGENYSDSERLLSIQTGLKLIKENPVLGTGIGDLEDKVKSIYLDEYKKTIVKLPHNQFVLSAAGMGLLLGVIYTLCFFIPLLYRKQYYDLFLLSFFIAMTLLCLVEKPLERSSFIAFYGLLVCAGISYNEGIRMKTSE